MIGIFSAILGALFGSFISNTLWQIRAIETHQKVEKSRRSVCGHCGHILSPKDLVPIFSWLFLKGRCRYCNNKLSIQYPLVEIVTSSLFIWSTTVWQLSLARDYVSLGLWLFILTGLMIMAVYDIRWMELPNKVMALTLGLAILWQISLAVNLDFYQHLSAHFLAAVAAGATFYGLHALGSGKWMGGGDVKLAFLMGIILGGQKLLLAMFVAFVLAAVFSLFMMSLHKLTRKDLIPFGPFLIFGTIFATLHGSAVIDAYINFYTP